MEKPKTIDEYLANVPEDFRNALNDLRRTIKSFIPEPVEIIGWSMPVIKYQGKQVLGFAAFNRHCSLMTMSGSLIGQLDPDEVKPFKGSLSTLHFTPENPLPEELVRKIVLLRLDEIAEQARKKIKC